MKFKTFSVMFAGQARFLDCAIAYKTVYSGATDFYASLNNKIEDCINLNTGSNYTITEQTFDDVILEFKKHYNFKKISILTEDDFDILGTELGNGWPLKHFYTFLINIPNINDDYLILSTTDIIFETKDNTMKKMINSIKYTDTPVVYPAQWSNEEVHNSFVVINRSALEVLKHRGFDTLINYKKHISEKIFKTEYAWFWIFNELGIKILKANTFNPVLRYRPNMGPYNGLKNLNDLTTKYYEYSDNKRLTRLKHEQNKIQ